MSIEHLYLVDLEWNSDRKGTLSSSALVSSIEVATPPEFPKGIAGIWSPEHLFVAAISSCLMTTFLAIAENSNLHFTHFSCPASGKLEMVDGKYQITEVTLTPILAIAEEAEREKALRVLQKAESNCLITHSVKSTILFQPEISIEENLILAQ